MIYLNNFDTHTSYEEKLNGGVVDISIPNVSYCEDVKDVHYTPYNLVRFYVGEVATTPQTVKIYTDSSTSVDVSVSDGNKWYSYLLPKDKGLYKIEGDSVKKVVVKADINTNNNVIIPSSTVEASFKGSNTSNVTTMIGMFGGCKSLTSLDLRNFNTSNVTNMSFMFNVCSSLKSLDLSNFNTSNVTNMMRMFNNCSELETLYISGWNMSNVNSMSSMFYGCSKLKTIIMKGCSVETVRKIQNQLTADGITEFTISQ